MADTDEGKTMFDDETREKLKKIDHVIRMNDRYQNVGARALSGVEFSETNERKREGKRIDPMRRRMSMLPLRSTSNVDYRKGAPEVKLSGRTVSSAGTRVSNRASSTVNMLLRSPRESKSRQPSVDFGERRETNASPAAKDWKPGYLVEETVRQKLKRGIKGIFHR